MAGIYIHIPFCRQACHYCDFHFSTSLKLKDAFLDALKKEAALRKNYLSAADLPVKTVYFGGGTPSLLTGDELSSIIDAVSDHFPIAADAEITLEANPDDLTEEKVRDLKRTPVNRFSIGIQSFFDEDLRFMNRAHNSEDALQSIKRVQDAGFENVTIDLIYGVPGASHERWRENLDRAFSLSTPHVSAYCLTVEDKTALAQMVRTHKAPNVDDRHSSEQFIILIEEMKKHGYIHYEISNFCKEGFYSRHNSSYWKGEKYLGLGPSAHSYNGLSRQWNVSNNTIYINSVNAGKPQWETETLSTDQRYNEYILTTLRTIWGTSLDHIEHEFGKEYLRYCLAEADEHFSEGTLVRRENNLFLSEQGKLVADRIASNLFIVHE